MRKRVSGGQTKGLEKEEFEKQMRIQKATIQVRVNGELATNSLVDSGSDCYALIDLSLAQRLSLPFVSRSRRRL